LNIPEQYNAITEQLLADLGAAFEAALADDGARAIALTGPGKGFCSGAQLGGDMFRSPAADVGKPVSAEGHQNR
jgi:2-(1,2-epoxy-1,2-dihydrophenyl)acetyl-CoA isomerase